MHSNTPAHNKLKLAYLTEYDATNVNSWSGLGYFIAKSLLEAGAEVELVGNLRDDQPIMSNLIERTKYFYNSSARRFMLNRSLKIAKQYAHEAGARLFAKDIDIVFAPSTLPVAFLKTEKPIVIYTDATFASMINYYPEFSGLSNSCIEEGHLIEQQALQKCSLAIYSSAWAAESAINFYGIRPDKVKVVPFGANLSTQNFKKREIVPKELTGQPIKMLFVGVDWYRKGGETVLQTCNELRKRGIDVTLDLAGIRNLPHKNLPAFVNNHGFLDKNSSVHQQKLEALYQKADFLFAPSLADCTPVIFPEAAAFALPVISRGTGGIPTLVTNDYNGLLLAETATIKQYADEILRVITNPPLYAQLSRNQLKEYKERLNWKVNGKILYNLLDGVMNRSVNTAAV